MIFYVLTTVIKYYFNSILIIFIYNTVMMNIHPKKNNIELPFTQLWYNFSKQCEKENKAIAKANK